MVYNYFAGDIGTDNLKGLKKEFKELRDKVSNIEANQGFSLTCGERTHLVDEFIAKHKTYFLTYMYEMKECVSPSKDGVTSTNDSVYSFLSSLGTFCINGENYDRTLYMHERK